MKGVPNLRTGADRVMADLQAERARLEAEQRRLHSQADATPRNAGAPNQTFVKPHVFVPPPTPRRDRRALLEKVAGTSDSRLKRAYLDEYLADAKPVGPPVYGTTADRIPPMCGHCGYRFINQTKYEILSGRTPDGSTQASVNCPGCGQSLGLAQ